jgi:hypothetical protein
MKIAPIMRAFEAAGNFERYPALSIRFVSIIAAVITPNTVAAPTITRIIIPKWLLILISSL